MKNTFRVAAIALTLSVPGVALAETPGWYLGLEGAYNYMEDFKVKGAGANTKAKTDNGWGVLGAVGYAFDPNWRIEFEPGFRHNGLKNGYSGHAETWSAMLNGYYDITTGTAFTPYVGVGIGYADSRDKIRRSTPLPAINAKDDDWNFAYQGIVGVAYALDTNWRLTLDYRYFSTLDPKIGPYKVEDHNHSVGLGIRYAFGSPKPAPVVPAVAPAPAPAPAPARAPASPRSFLVFFDFDRSTITQQGSSVIRQAFDSYKTAGATRVDVTGHTDTSGAADYNQRLSLRRAEAVKQELIKLGVPAGSIVVVGKGESQPLVATGDGVREPQNRRVEIVF